MKAPDVSPVIQIILNNSVHHQSFITATFFTMEGESIEYLRHEVPQKLQDKIKNNPEYVLDWELLMKDDRLYNPIKND